MILIKIFISIALNDRQLPEDPVKWNSVQSSEYTYLRTALVLYFGIASKASINKELPSKFLVLPLERVLQQRERDLYPMSQAYLSTMR